MKAMLLSAGVGRRMYPLTLDLPKAAIPVLGRPLAVQILHRLAQAGVEQAVLNLHHHPDTLRRLLGQGGDAGLPRVYFTYEETILGTAGGLRNAAHLLRGEGPILVHNGDFLADIDIAAALRAHCQSGRAATLVLAPRRPGYSVVDVDADGRVLSLAGEPRAERRRVAGQHLFTGCHVMEEEVLDRIPPQGPSHIVSNVYRELAREGRLGSFMHDGFWWEFGSPELYLEGSLRLLDLSVEQRAKVACHDAVQQLDEALAAIGAGVNVDDGARLRGRVALGLASRVGRDCHLEDSVVMPESWIGPSCRLERAVVAPGLELPAGFEVEQALVCRDSHSEAALPDSTRRVEGLLVHSFELRTV
jgi:NDP-sugar pyrophosphorylase family protein